jgi:sugar phosphate isomerase/epimerase
MTSVDKRLAVSAAAITQDARAAPALARQAGFAGIAFDAFAATLNLLELSASGRRDFRRELAGRDCKLVGLRADLGRHGLMGGGDIDRILRQCQGLFEAARDLGAAMVCLDLGPLPAAPQKLARPAPPLSKEMAGVILLPESLGQDGASSPPAPAPAHNPVIDAQASDAMAGLVEIGALADRVSIAVALGSSLAGFDSLLYALEQARCPWFGVDFDPSAIVAEGREVGAALAGCGQNLRHVRGRDAVRGERGKSKEVVIGHGQANWSQLLTLLDEAGYSGWITVDPIELVDRRAAAVAGLKQLLAWG